MNELDNDNNTTFEKIDTYFNGLEKVVDETFMYKAKDVLVQTTWELPIIIQYPDTRVIYDFSTAQGDVGFGIMFIPALEPGETLEDVGTEEIEEMTVIPCHTEPYGGEFTPASEGVVVFMFDNTHDWFANKKLTYNISVYQPSFSINDEKRCSTARSCLDDAAVLYHTTSSERVDAAGKVNFLTKKIPLLENKIATLQLQLAAQQVALIEAENDTKELLSSECIALDRLNGLCLRTLNKALLSNVLSYLPQPRISAQSNKAKQQRELSMIPNLVCKYWNALIKSIPAENWCTISNYVLPVLPTQAYDRWNSGQLKNSTLSPDEYFNRYKPEPEGSVMEEGGSISQQATHTTSSMQDVDVSLGEAGGGGDEPEDPSQSPIYRTMKKGTGKKMKKHSTPLTTEVVTALKEEYIANKSKYKKKVIKANGDKPSEKEIKKREILVSADVAAAAEPVRIPLLGSKGCIDKVLSPEEFEETEVARKQKAKKSQLSQMRQQEQQEYQKQQTRLMNAKDPQEHEKEEQEEVYLSDPEVQVRTQQVGDEASGKASPAKGERAGVSKRDRYNEDVVNSFKEKRTQKQLTAWVDILQAELLKIERLESAKRKAQKNIKVWTEAFLKENDRLPTQKEVKQFSGSTFEMFNAVCLELKDMVEHVNDSLSNANMSRQDFDQLCRQRANDWSQGGR